MNALKRYALVLSIYLTTRGFAYVVFEGPLSPIDWGIARKDGEAKSRHCLKLTAALFLRYTPDVLVLQDTSPVGTARSPRIAALNIAIAGLADSPGIRVHSYTREHVRGAFGHLGSPTKHAIAEAIAKNIPWFERRLPPPRKPWAAEDPRMGIFDAAALALTFFHDTAGGALP